MKTPLSSLTGSGINTDRISAASKRRMIKADRPFDQSSNAPSFPSTSFKREVPIPNSSEFVEIDGKKYFLDAPRGTYLNIIV